ncbi:MAG: hypothetical protein M3323_02895 [Actinomycetota bacterium]|nr:hypothetical protein [Actinomycetota bacterium]
MTATTLVLYAWAVNPPETSPVAVVEEPLEVTVIFSSSTLDYVDGRNVSEACIREGHSAEAVAVAGDLREPEVVLPD